MKQISIGTKTKDQVIKENIELYKDIYIKVTQQAHKLDQVKK